ncbi:aromatic ring-hydroxylating dioxygenase subunit alpha [Streptomyces sp. CBMA152]|uniref:aromatic ring-hydroxylating oxygenase subunit alpha n=1 Tax=Streptomyces sp. CBMA152 TaxID=1896312 RepID=UPI0016615FDA|nr:Rieske 2Fe-2S domain-containing protein [Streptomyces sp. CBMA152]
MTTQARLSDPLGQGPELPYPAGWFCVALSHELARGAVATRRFMGEDVVVYRTRSGAAHAVRPYCPHLGAHFGVGGTVEGELLVCPFHRFGFATDGMCVRTPDGPPPRARVAHHHLRERNGMLFVWHGHDDAPPAWELPDTLGANAAPTAWWATDVTSHPQEIIENIADYRHLSALHQQAMREVAPPKPDGPLLHLRLRIAPERFPRGGEPFGDQKVLLAGLGVLCTELPLPRLGLLFHVWSLPTPTGPWRSRLRFATACTVTDPKRLPGSGLATLRTALTRSAAQGVHRLALRIVKQDLPIWNTKRYEARPRLAPGDEAIGQYRRWARQFYPTG